MDYKGITSLFIMGLKKRISGFAGKRKNSS